MKSSKWRIHSSSGCVGAMPSPESPIGYRTPAVDAVQTLEVALYTDGYRWWREEECLVPDEKERYRFRCIGAQMSKNGQVSASVPWSLHGAEALDGLPIVLTQAGHKALHTALRESLGAKLGLEVKPIASDKIG